MTNIYAWPPVLTMMRSWNLRQPVNRSTSLLSGRRYVSASRRPRRAANLTIYGRRGNGIGYMAALERLLDGGANLVRLKSCRLSFGATGMAEEDRSSVQIDWRNPSPTEMDWRDNDTGFVWYDGAVWDGAPNSSAGRNWIWIEGMPPFTLVAVPGEFVTIYPGGGNVGETHMVVAPAYTNHLGNVRVYTDKRASGNGRVNFNAQEEGVFELISEFPAIRWTGQGPDNLELEFRQVFEDEIHDTIVEINPWT